MINEITGVANDILLKRLDGEVDPDGPYYNVDKELYLKYDSIQIGNAGTISVEVGYYWKGVKMAIFPVLNVRLDFLTLPSATNHIALNGINGSMRVVMT
jgi:hypothetical protein